MPLPPPEPSPRQPGRSALFSGVIAGPVLLVFVSSMLALAALIVGARLYGEQTGSSRSEQTFVVGVLFLLGIALPIHALGWSNHLTTIKLTLAALALSLGSSAVALVGVPDKLTFVRRASVRVLTTPWAALKLSWRDRSVVTFALAGTMGMLVYTAWLSYLAPASGWDGLWYHDAIVGFSIQRHGFSPEPLPPWHELINSYTRGSEYFNMFPVLLWDRRFIELAPTVFAAIALPGLTALFARFSLRPTLCIGLACTYVLLPALALQLRSTYIDVQVGIAYLAALYFVTRPDLRVRDAVLAAFAMGLLCNAKSSGLAMTIPVFGVFGLRILLRYLRRAPLQTVLGLLVAAVVVGLLGGPTYLRNYIAHKNPMYPLQVESKRLNIHWEGPAPVAFNDDFQQLGRDLFTPPSNGFEFPDTRTNGYGNAPPFIVLPGALLALSLFFVSWTRAALHRTRPRRDVVDLSWIVVLTITMALISPTWTWARFNLHVVVGLFTLFAWLLAREKRGALGEGAVSALLFTSFLTLLWSQPAWSVSPKLAWELAKQTPVERSSTQLVDFMLPKDMATARELQLGDGDGVQVEHTLDFISMAWNERYSNTVHLFSADDPMLAHAASERTLPKWIIVRPHTPYGQMVVAATNHWKPVGVFHSDYVAYRRIKRKGDKKRSPTVEPKP